MMALQKGEDAEENENEEPIENKKLKENASPEQKRGMHRVRSGSNLAAVIVESK